MIVKAYAKINLALKVKGKTKDGYHELDMVMLPLELHDSIDISLLPDIYETYVTCDDFSLETGEYNLCSIAVRKIKEKFNINKSFRIHIHKNIPIGAGLGGGSANAAAVIRAIKDLLKLKISVQDELEVAKSIGADVPFCLFNTPSRSEGEKLTPIIVQKEYFVLLIKPKRGLSTKEVYVKYDEVGSSSNPNVDKLVQVLKQGKTEEIPNYFGNDLEKASITLLPEIQNVKDELKEHGFEIVLMSGSGSAVFALSENKHMIEKEAKNLEKKGYNVFITKILK